MENKEEKPKSKTSVNGVSPKSSSEDKNKALALVLDKLDKQYGKGTVMRMGDSKIDENIEVISSGSLGLDIALGVGGYPKGRIIEIYGPESSGKTTLTLHAIAEAQKAGGIAAFIDAEHALDPVYAKKLGVDVCISTTGIAGPNGGSVDKPVGLVWIGLCISGKTVARKFQFGDNRERNIQMTVLSALNWLRFELAKG